MGRQVDIVRTLLPNDSLVHVGFCLRFENSWDNVDPVVAKLWEKVQQKQVNCCSVQKKQNTGDSESESTSLLYIIL